MKKIQYIFLICSSYLIISCESESTTTNNVEIFNGSDVAEISDAIQNEDSSSIYKFFQNGEANIDCQESSFGYSLLIWSVENNKPKSVRYLLDLGANPNLVTKDSSTALLIATYRSNLDVMKLLVSFGANIEVKRKNKAPKNLLDASVRSLTGDEFSKVQYLIEELEYGSYVSLKDCDNNVINECALFDQFEIVEYLVDKGANINCKVPHIDTTNKRGLIDLVKEMNVDDEFILRKDSLINYLENLNN